MPSPSSSSANVSDAFNILKIPQVNGKKGRRQDLPKAVTGAKALALFAEKERKKKEEELKKVMRRAQREMNKKQKEEEKIQKAKEKELTKQRRKRKKPVVEDSSSDSEASVTLEDENTQSDLSFDKIDKNSCSYCATTFTESDEESDITVVGCEICPRWAHRACTGDQTLMDLDDVDDIRAYPFVCFHCEG